MVVKFPLCYSIECCNSFLLWLHIPATLLYLLNTLSPCPSFPGSSNHYSFLSVVDSNLFASTCKWDQGAFVPGILNITFSSYIYTVEMDGIFFSLSLKASVVYSSVCGCLGRFHVLSAAKMGVQISFGLWHFPMLYQNHPGGLRNGLSFLLLRIPAENFCR